MSELIDRSVLRARMYSAAFESDTDMQRWDSGCWIRYKLFENIVDNMPTVPYTPRWRRVEEELPKYGQDVLAARLYGADADGWAYEIVIAHVCEVRGTNYWNATNITHWMPLPEPPKEDA